LKNKLALMSSVILALVIAAIVITIKVPMKEGLDIAGGVRVVLQAQTEQLPKGQTWDANKYLPSIIRIIRNRIDIQGVAEPLIQGKGTDQIIVELPDIQNKDEAIAALQSTARMEFRQLQNVKTARHPGAKYSMSVEKDDSGNEIYHFTDAAGNDVPTAKIIAESRLILTGDDISPKSEATKDQQKMGANVVAIEFTRTGKKKFADFTRRNVGEHLAIIMEDRILSAPEIREPILDGRAIISGNFTTEEAVKLAETINAGALPVPLKVIQVTQVEATLGQGSVDKSVTAGAIGLAAVVLFMVIYYLLPGLVADLALIIYALLTLAAFKLIHVTLTLPGIAAYILSIGMAVDANILIFERLKEELRSGKTLKSAIDAGFSRAFTSIFDSNMCTIITCAILIYYGTGPIRGFAVVLALGVAISMFTAITVTRTILYLLVNTGVATHPALFGLRRQWVTGRTGRQINVVKHMYLWFALSAAVLIPGMIFWGMGGLHRGIDFTGGSLLQLEFKQPADTAKIDSALTSMGLSGSMIQKSTSDPREVFVRSKFIPQEDITKVKDAIAAKAGEFTVQSQEQVGPSVSKELETNALMAVLLASIAIILYLAIRFSVGGFVQGLRFGVCAVVATLHDVAVIIGAFAILGYFLHWEIDSLFVTAVLTVIGFSTHDTIVIFDRIRENLKHKSRGEAFDDLVNRSILQSFARSINTSLTVVITLTALYIFGAHNIRQFVFALLLGVVTGTYSSIFNASQFLVLWQRITGEGVGSTLSVHANVVKAKDLKPLEPVQESVQEPAIAAAVAEAGAKPSGTAKPKAKKKKSNKRRY
jgi:SecD/SecF fusion protein